MSFALSVFVPRFPHCPKLLELCTNLFTFPEELVARADRKLEPNTASQVIANVSQLVKKFRDAGMPVFLVHVTSIDGKDMLRPITDQQVQWGSDQRPADWTEFIDEIKPTEKERQWGAFYGTELDLQLRRRKIETIVLCGVSTNIGVETTARDGSVSARAYFVRYIKNEFLKKLCELF